VSTPIPDGVTLIDHPLVQVKLTAMRRVETPVGEFRRNLRELAALMTFEVTRSLPRVARTIRTPLATMEGTALARPVVLAPILRAGLGMLEGMLQILPDAGVAHIGLFRNEETRLPESYYFKAPADVSEAEVVVADPMLATGGSAVAAIAQLKKVGARALRYVCLVSCPEGIAALRKAHPDVPIFTAAIDAELDDRAYIVPGLGDAGDRFFGTEG
jgi:uracil phosphoribosyltransferase